MSDRAQKREMERIAALLADETTNAQPLGAELAWLHQQHQRLERKFVKVAHISDRMQINLKESQESLLLAMQAAKATDIAKDRFIADVSHEIRTPLSSVLCILGMLDQQEDDPDKKELLKLALNSGESLLRLSSGILDLSRMDAGKLELVEEDFRLDQLIDRLVDLYAVTARAKGLAVRWECEPGVPLKVWGDALKLEQILRNLLDNAVKFTLSGEIVVRVEMRHGNVLALSVADSGTGIAVADLPYIFDSYRQGRIATGRRAGGTGLGLAITRRLVELMRGEITVESKPNYGSVFTFTLPLAFAGEKEALLQSPEPEYASGDAENPMAPATALRPTLDILLADDHRLFREIMSTMLEKQDDLRVVAGVGSGAEVLAAVREHRPDIVLLDLYLGTENGFELMTAIREASPATRIVILTSDDSTDSLRRGVELGIDGYLLKTLPAQELLQSLRAVGNGAMVLPAALKRRDKRPCPAPERPLSPRETEILQLIAAGKSNPEIAIITGTSENTVKSHVRALMEKLGAHNRVLLLATAARMKLLPVESITADS